MARTTRKRRTTATSNTTTPTPVTGLHACLSEAWSGLTAIGVSQAAIAAAIEECETYLKRATQVLVSHARAGTKESGSPRAAPQRKRRTPRTRNATATALPSLKDAILAVMPDTRPISLASLATELNKRYAGNRWGNQHIAAGLGRLQRAGKLVNTNGMWSLQAPERSIPRAA